MPAGSGCSTPVTGGDRLGDWVLRGGTFEKGMWVPKGGLGMAFVYEWMNVHVGYHVQIPDREHYLSALPDDAKKHIM